MPFRSDFQNDHPGTRLVDITPNDSTDIDPCVLYVGTSGNLKILAMDDSTAVTVTNVPVGIFPVVVKRVYSTDTTASGIVGIR